MPIPNLRERSSGGGSGGFQGLGALIMGIPEGLKNTVQGVSNDLQVLNAPQQWLYQQGAKAVGVPDNIAETVFNTDKGEEALGRILDRTSRQETRSGEVVREAAPLAETMSVATQEGTPTLREIAWNSPGRTAGRLKDTAVAIGTGNPGEIPYAQAWGEGNLAPVLVEDVSNLALAGSLASRGLSAAAGSAQAGGRLAPLAPQLENAAFRVGSAAQTADRIAGFPISVPAYPFRQGVRYLRGELPETGINAQLGALTAPVVRPVLQHAERVAARGSMINSPEMAQAVGDTEAWGPVWADVRDSFTPAEQQAFMRAPATTPEAVAVVDARLANAADPAAVIDEAFPGLTPEGFEVLRAYTSGDEAVVSRFREGWQRLTDEGGIAKKAEDRLIGRGESRPLVEGEEAGRLQEQGDQPLEWAIERDMLADPEVQRLIGQLEMVDQQRQPLLRQAEMARDAAATFEPDVDAALAAERAALDVDIEQSRRQLWEEAAAEPGYFHGTSRRFEGDELQVGSGNATDNLFGPGFYVTDNPNVAFEYRAKGAHGSRGEPIVYRAEPENMGNVVDFDQPMTPELRQVFADELDRLDAVEEQFPGSYADHASTAQVRELLDQPTTTGAMAYKAYKGLYDGIDVGDVDVALTEFNLRLRNAGYDAIRYQGGTRTGGQPHNAYVLLGDFETPQARLKPIPESQFVDYDSTGYRDAQLEQATKGVDRVQEHLARAQRAEQEAAAIGREPAAKLEQIRRQMEDDINNAPPDYAFVLRNNKRIVDQALKEADELDKAVPGSGDPLRSVAGEVALTLRDLHAQAYEQVGRVVEAGNPDLELGPAANSMTDLRPQKLRSEYRRKGDQADFTFEGQFERLVQDQVRRARNEAVARVSESLDPNAPEWFQKGVEKAVKDMARWEIKGENLRAALKGYDRGVGAVKSAFLPLNPRWNVANIFGNSLMMASEVRFRDYFPSLMEAYRRRRAWKRGEGDLTPEERETLRHGYVTSELADQNMDFGWKPQSVGQALRHPIKTARNPMYAFNEAIDDIGHLAVYHAKKFEAADLRRWVDEEVGAGRLSERQAKRFMDEADMTEKQALERSLKVMGDFTNMSPFEKNVIRRTAWFYPWYKHITKLMFRLPVEHPYRTAWTLHLADMFADNKDRPEWLQGAIALGDGRYLQVPINPFTPPDQSPINPRSAIQSVAPPVQWGSAAMGFNLGRTRLLTMSPGSYPTDAYGREQPGWIGPENFLGFMAGQFPQTRLIRDLTQGDHTRYDSGEPILRKGEPIPSSAENLGPLPAPLGGYLTGFTIQRPDLEEQAAIEAERRRRSANRREDYARERRRSGL